MASDFGVDKNKIDNYKHCENVSLKLSIPPHELLNLVSSSTEESSGLLMWLAIEKDYKKKFISQINEDSFEILLKGRVRGHYNTYAPWLYGQVIATEVGCEVTVGFKLNDQMRKTDKAYPVILILACFAFIANIIIKDNIIEPYLFSAFISLIVTGFIFLYYIFRLSLIKLTEKDKEMLCDFFMELIDPYKIGHESNN